jgi:hypothetical protein
MENLTSERACNQSGFGEPPGCSNRPCYVKYLDKDLQICVVSIENFGKGFVVVKHPTYRSAKAQATSKLPACPLACDFELAKVHSLSLWQAVGGPRGCRTYEMVVCSGRTSVTAQAAVTRCEHPLCVLICRFQSEQTALDQGAACTFWW